MSRTRGGRKVSVHVEYDPDDMIAQAHCHLCTWTKRGPMGEGFYVDVRNHILNHHAGQRGTTGARPPAKQS